MESVRAFAVFANQGQISSTTLPALSSLPCIKPTVLHSGLKGADELISGRGRVGRGRE